MSIEFDVDATTTADFSNVWESKEEEKEDSNSSQFHEKIFSPPFYPIDFDRKVVYDRLRSLEAKETDTIVRERLDIRTIRNSNNDRDREAGWSTEYGVTGKIGGSEGSTFEFYGKAEAHDDHGNYYEGSITYNDKGETRYDIHGSHQPD